MLEVKDSSGKTINEFLLDGEGPLGIVGQLTSLSDSMWRLLLLERELTSQPLDHVGHKELVSNYGKLSMQIFGTVRHDRTQQYFDSQRELLEWQQRGHRETT